MFELWGTHSANRQAPMVIFMSYHHQWQVAQFLPDSVKSFGFVSGQGVRHSSYTVCRGFDFCRFVLSPARYHNPLGVFMFLYRPPFCVEWLTIALFLALPCQAPPGPAWFLALSCLARPRRALPSPARPCSSPCQASPSRAAPSPAQPSHAAPQELNKLYVWFKTSKSA